MNLLKRLCETPGVSGFEAGVQELVAAELASCCDGVRWDRMGNVIGIKRAAPGTQDPLKLMIAAHVDEIGLMVTHIDDAGFIHFAPVGGFDPVNLVAQRVVIHGRRPLGGVIAPRILGGSGDRDKAPALEDLYIDTGLDGATVNGSVALGDIIHLDQDFRLLNDGVVTARNFDDRLGVYCLIEAMKRLNAPSVEVYAVSTVQEELGVRGAHPAAYAIEPDLGLAIDGSLAHDVPGQPAHLKHCALGAGTGIYIMDRLTLGNPRWVRFLIDCCQARDIPFQRNIGGGTDASAMQRAKLGAWSTTIGAPTRYMHSTVQLAHLDDIEATIALLVAAAERADGLRALLP